MKYCTYCGEKNEDNAAFCVSCGKKLRLNKSISESSVPTHNSKDNTEKRDKAKTVALAVLIFVLFIGCAVVGSKLFFSTTARAESHKEAQGDISENTISEEVEVTAEQHASEPQTNQEDPSPNEVSGETMDVDSAEDDSSISMPGEIDCYDALIEEYRQVMSIPDIDDQLESLMTEYPLLNFNLIQDAIINRAGLRYTLVDLNQDGTNELLINYMYSEQPVSEGDYCFFALYTQKDGQVITLITDCAYRIVCYWCGDGTIVEYGSGGALYGVATIFQFNESGDDLILEREYEVDYEKDPDAPYYDGEERLTDEEFDAKYVKIDLADYTWTYIG